jgi:excisionase family DNA binding protein
MSAKKRRKQLISAKEVCDYTGLDLATVYQKARNGEIPGAIWGETLCFKLDKFRKWWRSELKKALRELEEEGRIMSFVGPDGKRRYSAK